MQSLIFKWTHKNMRSLFKRPATATIWVDCWTIRTAAQGTCSTMLMNRPETCILSGELNIYIEHQNCVLGCQVGKLGTRCTAVNHCLYWSLETLLAYWLDSIGSFLCKIYLLIQLMKRNEYIYHAFTIIHCLTLIATGSEKLAEALKIYY